MEEKIYNLQKENKLLKLQLLHLSEDIELMWKIHSYLPPSVHFKVIP